MVWLLLATLSADVYTLYLQVAENFVKLISGKKPESFKLIVSSHNYQTTPSSDELSGLVATIQAVGADIVKIATTAVDIVDVTRMFQVIVHCQVSANKLMMQLNWLVCTYLLFISFWCSIVPSSELAFLDGIVVNWHS